MSALSAQIPVTNPEQEVLNQVVFQTYYRQLGIVSIHFGVADVYAAAQALSATPRGGTVTWVVQDRVFQWDGVRITPQFDTSPVMSMWLFGGKNREKNTVLTRKGFWTLYFPNVLGVAGLIQTFRVAPMKA